MGEYELAAFAAMRAVEIRVRQMCGYPDSEIGVDLMRHAFGPGGPLHEEEIERGERNARWELFAGAIGTSSDWKRSASTMDVDPLWA